MFLSITLGDSPWSKGVYIIYKEFKKQTKTTKANKLIQITVNSYCDPIEMSKFQMVIDFNFKRQITSWVIGYFNTIDPLPQRILVWKCILVIYSHSSCFVCTHHYRKVVDTAKSDIDLLSFPTFWKEKISLIPCPTNVIPNGCILGDVIITRGYRHVNHSYTLII